MYTFHVLITFEDGSECATSYLASCKAMALANARRAFPHPAKIKVIGQRPMQQIAGQWYFATEG